jgi:acetolactate synthase-1/3 small subunit
MAVHDPTPVRECILSVLVENRAGVLSHVVGLFSARGFNIDSLAVGETEDPTMSRITLVSRGDQRTIEQIKKQLNKLIDVIKIQDLTEEEFVDRELMIVKFKDSREVAEELKKLDGKYNFQKVEGGDKVLTLVVTETRENRRKLFELFKKIGVLEIAQTGAVALSKKAPKE